MDSLAGDGLLFDGHGQIEAELEEQLEEDVLLGAISLKVFDGLFQRCREIIAVRLPCPDVA